MYNAHQNQQLGDWNAN